MLHYNQTFRSLTLRECENSVDRDAWITIDLLILLQVSRLLELAAAMSSAQEKVTGNSKLDMSGIMAALAMAQEVKRRGYQAMEKDRVVFSMEHFVRNIWRAPPPHFHHR